MLLMGKGGRVRGKQRKATEEEMAEETGKGKRRKERERGKGVKLDDHF